ncbi:unnamed protein product [Amoebophrya sp. A25]|nr:unnamed protein product [Amoebophrya sp. A25]|eukprot:GSA25T00015672001.1
MRKVDRLVIDEADDCKISETHVVPGEGPLNVGWRVSVELLLGLEVCLANLRSLGWVSSFEWSPIGVYSVRLFVDEAWKTVFVDDRVALWQPSGYEAVTLSPLSSLRLSSIILAKAVQKILYLRGLVPQLEDFPAPDFVQSATRMLVGDGGEEIKAKNSRRTTWRWNRGSNCAWGAANCGSASRPKSGAVSWTASKFLEPHQLALTFTDHKKRKEQHASGYAFKMEHILDPRGCSLFYGVLEAVQAYVLRHWRGAWRQYSQHVYAVRQGYSLAAFLTSDFLLLEKNARDLLRPVLSKVKTGTASQEQGQKKTNSDKKHITSPRDNLEELRLAFEKEEKHWATTSGKKDPSMSFSLVVLAQIYEQYFGEVPSTKAAAKDAPRRERLEKIFFPDGKEIKSAYTPDQNKSLQPVFERLFSSADDVLNGDVEMSHELLDPRHLDVVEAAPAARTRAGPTDGARRCLFFRLQQQVRRSAKAEPSFDTFAADHYEDYSAVSFVEDEIVLPLFSVTASQWLKVSPGFELAHRLYAITALDVLAFPVAEVAPSPSTTNSADAVGVGRHLPPAGDYLLIFAIQQRAVGDATTHVWRGRSAKEVQEQGFIMETERLRDLPMDDYHCEVFNFGQTQVRPCPPLSTNFGTRGAASTSSGLGLRTAFEFLPERLLHLLNLSACLERLDGDDVAKDNAFWMPWENFVALGRDLEPGRGAHRVYTAPLPSRQYVQQNGALVVRPAFGVDRKTGNFVMERPSSATSSGAPPNLAAGLGGTTGTTGAGGEARADGGSPSSRGTALGPRASAGLGDISEKLAEQAEPVPAAGLGGTTGTTVSGGEARADGGSPSSGGTALGPSTSVGLREKKKEAEDAMCPKIVLAVLASVIAFIALLLIFCLGTCLVRADAAADEQWTPNPGGEQAYGGPCEQWTPNPAGAQADGGPYEQWTPNAGGEQAWWWSGYPGGKGNYYYGGREQFYYYPTTETEAIESRSSPHGDHHGSHRKNCDTPSSEEDRRRSKSASVRGSASDIHPRRGKSAPRTPIRRSG